MNILMTFVFLVFMFFYYAIMGSIINNVLKIKKKSLFLDIISGYIVFFFISFAVGVPCQFLKTSWHVFFILLLTINVIIFIFSFHKKYTDFGCFINEIKSIRIENIINFITKNWVLILFVFLFTLFSTANNMAFYQFNYDDFYYIGKVVNSIGTPKLLNENYYNGHLLINNSLDYARILNTYEITYGFLSTLFHINTTFFCRVSMVIHNYSIIAIVIKYFATLFIDAEAKSQYALLPFFLLLIPQGYLMERGLYFFDFNLKIRLYDLWQFQTAIWYGSSIVRVIALPLLLIYSLPLIKNKITLFNFLFIVVICCVLMSFTTGSIPIIVFSAIILFFIKYSYLSYAFLRNKQFKKFIFYILIALLIVVSVIITKRLDHTFILPNDSYNNYLNNLLAFKIHYLGTDFIYNNYIYILVIAALFLYKSDMKYVLLFIFILIILVVEGFTGELLCLTSFKYVFVSLRLYSSIQFLLIIIFGIIIYRFFAMQTKSLITNMIAITLIVSSVLFIYDNYDDIRVINFLGSGIDETGYDFSNVIKYKNMRPKIFDDISDYFNSLPYGNYTLLVPNSFKIGNYYTNQAGFNMISNRIQIIYRVSDDKDNENYEIINQYINDDISIEEAKKSIDYFKDAYILVFSEKKSKELKSIGYKIELQTNDYYLMFK